MVFEFEVQNLKYLDDHVAFLYLLAENISFTQVQNIKNMRYNWIFSKKICSKEERDAALNSPPFPDQYTN